MAFLMSTLRYVLVEKYEPKMLHNSQYYYLKKTFKKSHLRGALSLKILSQGNRLLVVNPRHQRLANLPDLVYCYVCDSSESDSSLLIGFIHQIS